MKRIFTTTLRLNLDDMEERRAWEHLQRMDRQRYKSYSNAVVRALNDYFDRQERLMDDPYLETREKEDAFLQRIQDAIAQGMQCANTMNPACAAEPEPSTSQEADVDAALAFADSF